MLAPARWSLRTRLVTVLIVLLAVVGTAVGVVTQLVLQRTLVDQVDGQLAAAAARSADGFGGPPSSECGHGGPDALLPRGQAAGTLGACVEDGRVVDAAVLDDAGEERPMASSLESTLAGLPADGEPRTRSLGELGDYRLVARATSGGDVIVTGLPLTEIRSTLLGQAGVTAVVVVLALFAAGLAGAVIIRRALRPLHRVAATAAQVAQLPLDRGEVALGIRVPAADTDPRTEVGRVGAALNTMLGHVGSALAARHASEMRVRQFVADASHELRTPLAAIRGYAELARRTGQPVPVDIAHALGRVESEAARMTALVDDLLLLARLDSGRPLEQAPVDLSRLVVDAVSDARAAGPDHEWQLDLPPLPVTVIGDEARLHQVLVNLLANARVHTRPGTTVTARLRGGLDAVLTVADDGPGIPASLVSDVFERFGRADSSRSPADGSTGLGLAIVSAVVAAHGGNVEMTSEPGRTVFGVRLPTARGFPAGAQVMPS
jgi:two-component system, OmpR family, sensor kinase